VPELLWQVLWHLTYLGAEMVNVSWWAMNLLIVVGLSNLW
jgi:hypothetical protein